MTRAAEAAMRDYLASNRGDRHGRFVYSTDLIDGDIDALNEEFAPYRERFGLDIERRKIIRAGKSDQSLHGGARIPQPARVHLAQAGEGPRLGALPPVEAMRRTGFSW
mgnify:CR=1 FL=1